MEDFFHVSHLKWWIITDEELLDKQNEEEQLTEPPVITDGEDLDQTLDYTTAKHVLAIQDESTD